MIFDELKGHSEVKKRLIYALSSEKVSHAYIFSGKRGVGKSTAARIFANELTLKSKADVTVVSNELYDASSKSDVISVKAVRGASADMYKKPYAAKRRVFIFPNAEKMTVQAQNALLKTFEEPPSYCVIILITQNDNMLLQTIRSRAVTMRFGEISVSDLAEYAAENGFDASAVMLKLASGSIGMLESLCKDEALRGVLDRFVGLFEKIGSGKASDIYRLIEYIKNEKENSEILFDVMTVMLHGCVNAGRASFSLDGISAKKAVRIVDIVENTRNSFAYNASFETAVSEMMLDILGAVND